MGTAARSALALLVVAIAGWFGYSQYQASLLSPFRMWDTRAGKPFAAMDSEALHDTKRHFECVRVAGKVQQCEFATGVTGTMRVAVDGAGRVMIVQWRVADSSLKMKEEARRIATEWTQVESRKSVVQGVDGPSVTRWVTPDGAWSAYMSDFAQRGDEHSVVLVDERRLTRLADANAPAVLALASAGMLDGNQLRAAVAHSSVAMGAAARTAGERGRARALASARLPRCGFMSGDTIVAGDGMRRKYASNEPALLEEGIARAFPGFRLQLAQRAYLVDSVGAAEEVQVLPPTTNGDRIAFAITYPRRVAAVNGRLRTFADTAGQCRAPSEIVLARRDAATGHVVEATRSDVDADAMASDVTALAFGQGASGLTILVGKYRAFYGTADWLGEIDWDAVLVPSGGSLRITERVPTLVGRKGGDNTDVAGVPVVEATSPAGQQIWIMSATALTSSRMLVTPGPGGLPSGWMLLDMLP